MVIKEVERLDVYKKKINLMQYSKNYKKLGNEILNFYNQRLIEKSDYLNRIKNNNSKLLYLKELIRVKKYDKKRLIKIKRTEPFPLFSYKKIKKAKSVKLKYENKFKYNRILYMHKIYDKLKKKFFYYKQKLKKLKKSKFTFKLKFHL